VTIQLDHINMKALAPGALEDARARLAPMLESATEARLILTQSAEIACANAVAADLIDGFCDIDADMRAKLRHWLLDAAKPEFEIKLPFGGKLTAFALHKIKLDLVTGASEAAPLFLILARQPNLSGHLIQALSQSRALYKDIAQTIPGLLWETRADGTFSFIGGTEILGIDQSTLVDTAAHEAFSIPAEMAEMVFSSRDSVHSVDIWVKTEIGRRCLSISATPTLSKAGVWVGARGIAMDVTADRLASDAADTASQQMITAAQTDGLTGLLNRRGFEDSLEKICGKIRAADSGGFLALIDLDKFKQLNDTHGHQKGDEALVYVADVLEQHTRRGDVCARLGGDEFIIWIDDASKDGVHRICNSLIGAMPQLCIDMGLPGFGLSMSIGVTQLRPGRDTAESLVERADKTMYRVKNSGRGAYLFSDDEEAQ